MIYTLIEMFNYPFFIRALTVGVLVCLCLALLGVSLVLKGYSMIGDGLSHVGFGALALAGALGLAPLPVSIVVVTAAAFCLLQITQSSKLRSDSAIALIATSSLAIGVMIVSLGSKSNTDITNYLFGSILSLSRADTVLSIAVSILVLILFVLFYHKIFAVTFDETFAQATGVKTRFYNTMIALFTAVSIVLGMRMMGSLLISSLIVFPPLCAMRMFKSFLSTVICSATVAIVCFLIGLAVSCLWETPIGASVVCVNLAALAICSAIGALRKRRA